MSKKNEYPNCLTIEARLQAANMAIAYTSAVLMSIEALLLPALDSQYATMAEKLKSQIGDANKRLALAQSAMMGHDAEAAEKWCKGA